MNLQKTKNRGFRFDKAVSIFKKHGGILRTAQALRAGIHPGTLYALRDSGTLEAISRVSAPATSQQGQGYRPDFQ